MLYLLLALGTLLLAWSNGANDNFKGVATLYGSGTVGFRAALIWTTLATFLGSLLSVMLAWSLALSFSGKGLLPDNVLDTTLLLATAGAAAATILLATLLGMPTSTTHALTGALVGAGLATVGTAGIDWHRLTTKFAQPLLLSPVLAVAVTVILYLGLHRWRQRLAVEQETCICVGETANTEIELPSQGAAAAITAHGGTPALQLSLGRPSDCSHRYSGMMMGIRARRVVDLLHFASAGAVCFARAVNDTPKIAALILGVTGLTGAMPTAAPLALVALVMALGSWFQSRKVAETMSNEITDLNPGQGLTANLVTAALVLGASRLGLPVSTTHVSCGSIFGIGVASRKGRLKTIAQIVTTWVTTLPLALVLGYGFFWLATLLG